jgi:hypothetical protein
MLQSAIARATTSSLKLHRSSIEPPPRHTISTSHPAGARPCDRLGDLLGRALSLHRHRIQHHAHVRRAPPQRRQDVAQRRRLRTGDDADGAREQRQRALALFVEQALGPQLFLQAQEGFVQLADAGAADRLDIDLVIAARTIKGDQGAHLDLVAFARHEAGVLGAAAEHHRAHLGRIVLQREIPVAGRGAGEIRHLAADPYQRKRALQQARDLLVESGDGQDGRGGVGRIGVVVTEHELGWITVHKRVMRAA